MSAPNQPNQALTLHRGIVKQVLSGDSVIIRGPPKGGPPPEKQICLSNINAPKLARRANPNVEGSVETKDEPFAWEAREFLRKKLIGKEVCFTVEYKVPGSGREYGCIYLGKDTSDENVTELIIKEGLVEVRRGGIKPTDSSQKLCALEDEAKAEGVGKWAAANTVNQHIRDIKWTVENPRNFVDSLHCKPVKGVIEHVRDGCTVRAFLNIDNVYYHATVMMSGVRCPMFKVGEDTSHNNAELFAEEAKFFTESRLLQRDVEIVLESVSNQNFLGSILHPNGSIAEFLLKEGFARCVDWSIAIVTGGPDKLRAAERIAKEKRLRVWKDFQPTESRVNLKDKEFQAKVIEIVNADAVVVMMPNNTQKKLFLASIRPPRLSAEAGNTEQGNKQGRNFRPLYDVPYMFEAREFLRKKLIGKKVNVSIDYIQASNNVNNLPERTCCTVTIGGQNVAEALVSKGLASVVRYRQDDDQRSAHYDDLLAAEMKAQKSGKGQHNKKEPPSHRVADVSGDATKAKQFLPFLQRAGRSEGVVEFVASGSRLRIYIPRETCLITFLLAGISCPKAARTLPSGTSIEGEPYGVEALAYTRELCLQKEVEVEVETMDKAGNFIGWLWIDGQTLSVTLVEEGLASVHFTAERSSHFRALQTAEENAKKSKKKMWSSYEESVETEPKDEVTERKVDYLTVVITEVTDDLHFYAQKVDQGAQLIQMMDQLRQEFIANLPLPGAYTPRRGDICAAKFSEDGEWYRAKVEKITSKGEEIHVLFIDYGNREITESTKLATLPAHFAALSSFAKEYALACINVPTEIDFQVAARNLFLQDCMNRELLLNSEYRVGMLEYVSVMMLDTKDDIGKGLVTDGLLTVEKRKERRLQKLIGEYKAAEESAKRARLNIWRYGDITEDDAKEFGVSR